MITRLKVSLNKQLGPGISFDEIHDVIPSPPPFLNLRLYFLGHVLPPAILYSVIVATTEFRDMEWKGY